MHAANKDKWHSAVYYKFLEPTYVQSTLSSYYYTTSIEWFRSCMPHFLCLQFRWCRAAVQGHKNMSIGRVAADA